MKLKAKFITTITISTPLKHVVLKPSDKYFSSKAFWATFSPRCARAAAICMHVNFPKWECYRRKRFTFYALGEILMRHSHTEATSRFRRNPNLHTRVMLQLQITRQCNSHFEQHTKLISVSNENYIKPPARGTRFVGRCPGKLRKA
jgi:hypothetical protein